MESLICSSFLLLVRCGCRFERACRKCGDNIHFLQSGDLTRIRPFDDDGRLHWATCIKGQEFRKAHGIQELPPAKKKPKKQGSLFDPEDN